MATQIKLRRDTSANWTNADAILAQGEPGFETDTGKLKIGDGITAWSSLIYVTDLASGGLLSTLTQGVYELSLDTNGNVIYPGNIVQSSKDLTNCAPGVETVIYTATGEFKHSIRLFVMIEGAPEGSQTGTWETQACDIIAVKGFVDNVVHVTAYGVTYSGSGPLATFDGQWNATTNRIEVTCLPTSTTNDVYATVHAIELNSND